MSSIKDLFKRGEGVKGLAAQSLTDLTRDVESTDFLKKKIEQKNQFIPNVDFRNPGNFAKYGLASQYYTDSFNFISEQYPYDGSLFEKLDWEVSSSFLDKYIFENQYPRRNGYVIFGNNYGTLSSISNGYGNFGSRNEIVFFGGPHTASSGMIGKPLSETFSNSNILDATRSRENNLHINGVDGVTVEFWYSRGAFVSGSESPKQVVLDIWNSSSFGSPQYGRLRIETHPGIAGQEDKFHIELVSGTSGFSSPGSTVSIGSNLPLLTSSFNHYSFTLKNNGSNITANLYRNGSLNATITTGSAISLVTGSMLGSIGALKTSVSGVQGAEGHAKLSGSLDEFRFWKTDRNAEQIGRFWFTQVGGGTNTDVANTKLGVYYKFNEGIYNPTSSNSIDAKILDYSGRISNGTWLGYTTGSRSTGSAMVIAGAAPIEFKDPIIYKNHRAVLRQRNNLIATGTAYDDTNNASLYNSIPQWILDEDQTKGRRTVLKLVQTMASSLDNLYLKMEKLPELKNISYISGTQKPTPFVNMFLENVGLSAPEILENASSLEVFADRDDFREFEERYFDVRNKVYQNIYNNLAFLYKSKGTEKTFRNIVRCFGIGDELVRLNLYADGVTYDVEDDFRSTIVRKKYADFNNVDRFDSTVFGVTSSATPSRSYILGSSNANLKGQTYEAEVLFPKKFDKDSELFFATSFTTSSIFGAHTSLVSDTDKTWASPDVGNFQVQAVKTEVESKDVRFRLTSSVGGVIPTLVSPLFDDVYNNEKWNFSVRIKHSAYPRSPNLTGSETNNYIVEFKGFNYVFDTIQNQFTVTQEISLANGNSFMSANKRMFAGAHRTNFTGSVLQLSDIKVSSVRTWMDYLEDDVLKAHARDASNFGRLHPVRPFDGSNQNGFVSNSPDAKIPQIETLALHWNFENVTGSGPSSDGLPTTSDATFEVNDISSGSNNIVSNGNFGWLSSIVGFHHPAQGNFYLPNSTNVINREYIHSAKQQHPEVLNSDSLVKVLTTSDDVLFTKEIRPFIHHFTVEKSMYSIMSDEMMNMFGSIKDFHSLIGDPVNRYRPNYQDMDGLRRLYFERVNNIPDFEKFIEYFKWVDSSISQIIRQFIPASAKFSPEVRNIIESHILERNKYWTKFPTLEFKNTDPEGGINGINELTYNWKTGHAPIPLSENQNGLWWREKAERNLSPINPGNAGALATRNAILNVKKSALNRSFTTPVRVLAVKATGAVNFVEPGRSWDKTKVVSVRNLKNSDALTVISASVLNSHQPLGNYKNDYEVITVASGRRLNNRWFVKNEGLSGLNATIITDTLDTIGVYSLPDRSAIGIKNKYIFVERFSAPGGPDVMSEGFLDTVGGEVSIFNEMNQRNAVVRIPLKTFRKTHTAKFGLNSSNPSLGNFHKVHRNTRYIPTDTGIIAKYDNDFVVHAIPQNEKQNSWITASAATGAAGVHYGYSSNFSVPNGLATSATQSAPATIQQSEFGSNGSGAGTWGVIKYQPNIQFRPTLFRSFITNITTHVSQTANTEGFPASLDVSNYINRTFTGNGGTARAQVLNSLLLMRDGPYQYPSFVQIRTGDKITARKLRKENILSILNPSEQRTITTNTGEVLPYRDIRSDSFTNFVEPPVTFRHKPLVHKLEVTGSSRPVTISHTYGNNIGRYGNPNIIKHLGEDLQCESEMYDSIKGFYLSSDLDPADNPTKGFILLKYREGIFPKERNTGLFKVRSRGSNYAETSSLKSSVQFDFGISGSSPPYQTLVTESVALLAEGHNGIDRGPNDRRSFWHSDVRKRNRFGEYNRSLGTSSADNYKKQPWFTTTKLSSQGERDGLCPSIWPFGQEMIHTQSLSFEETVPEAVGIFTNYDFGELDALRSFAYDGLSTSSGDFPNLDSFIFREHLGEYFQKEHDSRWGTGSSNPNKYSFHYLYPTASISYTCNTSLDLKQGDNSNGAIRFESNPYPIYFGVGPHRWRTGILSGKVPAFDSYEEYAQDIRLMGKDYSVIPEFNISEHMPYYVNDKGGNFLSVNDQFLEIKGGEPYVSKSAPTQERSDNLNGFSEKFFSEYSHSDMMQNFDVIIDDHKSDEFEVSRITMKCHGIKKLLPYNGFYPMTRCVQLAQLFSQSFGPHISGYKYNNGVPQNTAGPSSGSLALQAMLQPFFAPGILFNTIKSGIAMDWACITGSFTGSSLSVAAGSIVDTGYYKAVPNYRIPFETLVDLRNGSGNGGIPLSQSVDSGSIQWMYPNALETNATFQPWAPLNGPGYEAAHRPVFFQWNGEEANPLYRLAMHNFLAENINFFMKNNQLSAIYSNQVNRVKSFEAGVTYYMDVKLYRTSDILMYGQEFNYTSPLRFASVIGAPGSVLPFGPYPENQNALLDPGASGSGEFRDFVELGMTGMYFGPPFSFLGRDAEQSTWSTTLLDLDLPFQERGLERGYFLFSDYACAPHLPPYWFGESIARVSYVADGTEDNSLNLLTKIFSSSSIENIDFGLYRSLSSFEKGNLGQRVTPHFVVSASAWIGRSTVSSSVNIFGIAKDQKVTYDAVNQVGGSNRFRPRVAEDTDSTFAKWVISTRYETPILNFKNQPQEYYRIAYSNDRGGSRQQGMRTAIPKGMWSGYGEFPQGSTGIYLRVEESFPDKSIIEKQEQQIGSLIDVFGFDTSPRKLGQVSEGTEISECVVAIPFVDLTSETDVATVEVIGRRFIAINKDEFNRQRQAVDAGEPAVPRDGVHGSIEVQETSITSMIKLMRKYVIPPELNFDTFFQVPPFVMYMFEFTHELDRQDLADIWQGVLPKIGYTAEKQTTELAHDIKEWEFFGGKQPPKQMRWLVFKVKKKAAVNYFEKTADSQDDNRFRFDFQTRTNIIPEYSYNYPYDYCSLVELGKIEAGIDIEPKEVEGFENQNFDTFSNTPNSEPIRRISKIQDGFITDPKGTRIPVVPKVIRKLDT